MNIGSGYQMPRLGSEAQYASIPQNAQPAQGQMAPPQAPAQQPMQPQMPQQQAQLPTFLSNQGGLGAGLRGICQQPPRRPARFNRRRHR
jgi:hypothetical protein